jgi:hypothetical protein
MRAQSLGRGWKVVRGDEGHDPTVGILAAARQQTRHNDGMHPMPLHNASHDC